MQPNSARESPPNLNKGEGPLRAHHQTGSAADHHAVTTALFLSVTQARSDVEDAPLVIPEASHDSRDAQHALPAEGAPTAVKNGHASPRPASADRERHTASEAPRASPMSLTVPTRVAGLGEDSEEVHLYEMYAGDSPGSRSTPLPPPREEEPYPQDLLSNSAAQLLRLPFTDCVSFYDLSRPVQLPVPTA